jgi:hypothetical protein
MSPFLIPVIFGEFSETGFVSITFEIGELSGEADADGDACGADASCDGAVTGALEPDEESLLEVAGAGEGLGVFAVVEVFVGAGEGALVFFSTVVGAAGVEDLDCVESFAAVGLGDCEGVGEMDFLAATTGVFDFTHANFFPDFAQR